MNINLVKLKFSDKQVQYFLVIITCLIVILLAFFLGVSSVENNDCSDMRRDRDLAIERVHELENDKIIDVGRVEKDIKIVQRQICREQIEQFKQEYKALRCKICKGQNK
ncbi:MAG TPA: hypothetical protein DF712_07605 [Balneola sp.]|nr:hypothetical protein [Balneola sp.]